MPTKNEILQALPAYMGSMKKIKDRQDTQDIVRGMARWHKEDAPEYDLICGMFWTGDIYTTGADIFDFLKVNVRYNEEPIEMQTIRSPAAIVATGRTEGADCKNFSAFAAGVLDGLKRAGCQVDWCYRYAGYNYVSKEVGHVFVVIYPGTECEIWLDGTIKGYDEKTALAVYFDKKVKTEKAMALYRISGAAAPVTGELKGAEWQKLYIPENQNAITTTEAMRYGLLKNTLENDVTNEVRAGVLVMGSSRLAKYNKALLGINKKIAMYEASDMYNFGRPMDGKAINGGIESLLYGGKQLQALQAAIPAMAIDFLYLYIPVSGPGTPFDSGFLRNGVPGRTHDYTNIVPPVVLGKLVKAYHTSWDWGDWANTKVEDNVYPLLYGVITKMMGMSPETFWSMKLGVPITQADSGVFAGLSSTNNASALTDSLVSNAVSLVAGITGVGTYLSILGSALGVSNVQMTYPVSQFQPAPGDWAGTKYNPFPNGFPPAQGFFAAPATVSSGIISTVNPNNPVPASSGLSSTTLLMAAAALGGLYLYSKNKK